MKKLIALVLLLAAATCLFAAKVNKIMPFTKGLNLSIWLEDLGGGNSRSLLFNRQDFEDIKSLGVEIVRIPIWFEEFSSGEPDYIVEDWLWEKIDNAVEWCTELEMYVIIDFHNNTAGDTKTRPDIEKVLLKIWPQIAERYKDSGEYILYEIMNEPHMKSGNMAADVAKWGKLQGNVLKEIRKIDKTHTVIVCAEDFCSVSYLLKLPDYKDDNLIYNFHDYSPFLFTQQGGFWVGLENVRHIPFPYSKEKMPPIPKNATDSEKWLMENYKQQSSEATLAKPLDEAVKFANKRGVALMCNEYGVDMTYADSEERINWYRLKAKWMDERNIIRLSWDYRDHYGIFKNTSYTARFPEDLNIEIIEAMGYEVPKMENHKHYSWFENAKRTGDYTIYRNGFIKGIVTSGEGITKLRINKKDSPDGEMYIHIPKAPEWGLFNCLFGENCDLSELVNSGKVLEFEARTAQRSINMQVYFEDTEIPDNGREGFAWRCQKDIRSTQLPADGNWHKISIPLKEFADIGAWNDYEKKWIDSEGLFSWSKVNSLTFAFYEKNLQNDVSIRNIAIR